MQCKFLQIIDGGEDAELENFKLIEKEFKKEHFNEIRAIQKTVNNKNDRIKKQQ